jgi:Flp pilus assembly protein TadG
MHQRALFDYLWPARPTGSKSLFSVADSFHESGVDVASRSKSPLNLGISLLMDESGQSTMLVAAFIGILLLGFVALGLDVGYLFHEKRMAQAAADAAAVAAAEEATAGNSLNETAVANAMAKLNGFDPNASVNPATVTPPFTPTHGNYANAGAYVEVDVSKPVPTFFLGLLNPSAKTVVVSARAVAGGGQSSPTCICLEGPHGTDFAVGNAATVTANQCGIVDDSDGASAPAVTAGAIGGGGSISALALSTVSSAKIVPTNGAQITSSTTVVTGLQSKCAPTLPAVPTYDPTQCTADPLSHYGNGSSSYSIGPNGNFTNNQQGATTVCYSGGLTIGSNNDTVTLNPGIYVINGGTVEFKSGANGKSNLGGNGVFFYLTNNASLVIDNGANVNLVAPTSGTYAGTLIFQDPSDTNAMTIAGGSTVNVSGIIYAPTSNVALNNGSNTTINADFVAYTLTLSGGENLKSYATTNLGTLNLSVAKLTE